MTHWVQWGLMLCCLGLSGLPVGAAAETDGDEGGIFSSILMWFQDPPADVAPEREDEETDATPADEADVMPVDEADATSGDETDVTPSHVHQATLDLIAEI